MRRFAPFFLLVSLLLPSVSVAAGSASAYPTGPATVNVGQEFNVVINASGVKDVDTIRMNGSYTQDLLEYRGSKPTGVFQNVSPGTYVDQPNGIFSFGAFTLSSHANGVAPLAVLTFRAKKPGKGYIQLTTTSKLLSAGEDQLGSVGRLNITISEKVAPPAQPQPIPSVVTPEKLAISLRSPSHPNPDKWYATSTVAATWELAGKAWKKVYIGFDESPEGKAEQVIETTSTVFQAPSDNVWYVHLGVDLKDGSHESADLRVQVDRTNPRPIGVTVDQTLVPASIPNMLRYGTIDDASGVERYEIFIDDEFVTSTAVGTYPLLNQKVGVHKVVVTAYDRAGNNVSGTTEFEVVKLAAPAVKPPSNLWLWAALLAVIVILLVINYRIFGVKKKKRRGKK